MPIAYYDTTNKEIRYVDPSQNGIVTINNESVIVKTNDCYTEYIPATSSFNKYDHQLDIDKRYIIHISGYFVNNDITFLDKFESIEQVIQDPYYIDIESYNNYTTTSTSVYRQLLLDTCNSLIYVNVTFNVDNITGINIHTNYDNLSVLDKSLIICVEEI